MTREITLTRGMVALVDEEDFEMLSARKWRAHSLGYAVSSSRYLYMHRVITLATPGEEVDHINLNRLDNRRSNLRICSRQENACNQAPRDGASAYKGVCWDLTRGLWKASICSRGRQSHLGYFDDEVDAAMAYDVAAMDMFGAFARPNFLAVA